MCASSCRDKRKYGLCNAYIRRHMCIYIRKSSLFREYLNLKHNVCNMSIVLNVLLIILFSGTYGRDADDFEIILISLTHSKNASEVPLSFKVFGRLVDLTLRRNDKIIAPGFQFWKYGINGVELQSQDDDTSSCHYLHRDDFSSASINFCQDRQMSGLVFLDNVTLEIIPVRNPYASFFNGHYVEERSNSVGEPHVVKRTTVSQVAQKYFEGQRNNYEHDEPENMFLASDLLEALVRREEDTGLTLELAMFFDEAGYNIFSPFFGRNDGKLRDMLLAYINGVQALYHHPSLGVRIDISLVRLEVMESQPRDLPAFAGERGSLLDSFCNYARTRNYPDDSHPSHWDMGLYVSGLDFFAVEDGRKNSATMGLATVGGVCIDQYACVIAELGVTNQFGKPYPSAGFTSVYIAAHEIGHNLGMHHDSTGNACPKDGYIMSPSRGTQGETIWSECSRDVAEKLSRAKPCLLDKPTRQHDDRLDHTRYLGLPGREWTAKRQCELLLRDKDASVVTLYKACEALQCQSPHRSGYYFAGPALEGTYCAPGRECQGGECVARVLSSGSDRPSIQAGGWGEWKPGACSSGCLLKSKGAQARRRFCNNPPPKNTELGCQGLHYDVMLCRDEKLCKKKRRSIGEFATLKCTEFSERLPELDGKGGGLQAPHEPERPWMACAIFCRRKDIASYYTPRVELNDLGLDPYFPDGTWCHTEEGKDYFCRQHHCLPEDFQFAKKLSKHRQDDDIGLGPQNARPGQSRHMDRLVKYLSLGPDGLPLLTSLPFGIGFPPDEDEWIDKDYVELPEPLQQALVGE